jgi:hypothetical protein
MMLRYNSMCHLCEIAQPLEDRSIAEVLAIFDERPPVVVFDV